ncbi:MAG TPA: rod shape-determining protein MreC [Gammaproteobacteria bacterium]|nr:rod shape-determining protein MreC [Gammaproteobacteria bacterium]
MSAAGRTANTVGRGGAYLGLRFLVLVLVCLALMVLDERTDRLHRLREGLSVTVYPIQALVDLPFKTWRWATVALADRRALLADNERLKREQLLTDARLQRLAALESENTRLRKLLDSTGRLTDRVLVAEILSVDLDPYRQRFELNRGRWDGAYVGQALLDADGVVGQLVRVGPMTAQAVLITDADHAVPVTINRNGLRTIAVGTGDTGRLRLPYLTNTADVQVGDLLLSSGLGGVFPPGYPVGRIVEVKVRPGQSFADVIAEPASALDREREVLLVWTADDTGDGSPSDPPVPLQRPGVSDRAAVAGAAAPPQEPSPLAGRDAAPRAEGAAPRAEGAAPGGEGATPRGERAAQTGGGGTAERKTNVAAVQP